MSVSVAPSGERGSWLGGTRIVERLSPELWLLGGVVVAGVVIRFATLGQQSFWYDEAFTYAIVQHGLGHVFHAVPQTESTPPLYYVLLWFWSRAFGIREVGLRSFSAVCGVLTIPLLWELGRRMVNARVAFAAALLTAVSPILFWYSQEARAYSLLVLLSAATLLALLRALERPSVGRLLAWSGICALALCTHYFAVFVIVPEAAWLAFDLRSRGALDAARVAAGLLPVLAMGGALLPLMAHQDDGRASALTAGGSVPYRLTQFARQDLLGFGQPHKALASAAAAVLVALAIGLLGLRTAPRERQAAVLPLTVGAGGALLALIVSVLGPDYFVSRNLLPTWPAFALVLAIGFGAADGGRLGTAALAALAALSVACVAAVVSEPSLQRPDWRGAARAIGPARTPRIVIGDRLAENSLLPYLPALSAYPAHGAPVGEIDAIEATASQAGPKPEAMPTPTPPPGFRLAKAKKTPGYIVVTYVAARPVLELRSAVLALGPRNGEDRVMLQR